MTPIAGIFDGFPVAEFRAGNRPVCRDDPDLRGYRRADSTRKPLHSPVMCSRRLPRQHEFMICRDFPDSRSRRRDSNSRPLHYEGRTSSERASTRGLRWARFAANHANRRSAGGTEATERAPAHVPVLYPTRAPVGRRPSACRANAGLVRSDGLHWPHRGGAAAPIAAMTSLSVYCRWPSGSAGNRPPWSTSHSCRKSFRCVS